MIIDSSLGGISIGRYENGREQGYVITLRYRYFQVNYAVYEHRNCDELCIIRNIASTINTPTLETMSCGRDGKWGVDKRFSYGEWQDCANWIEDDMREELEKWMDYIRNKCEVVDGLHIRSKGEE
jgi:hypothetical protein